MEKLLHEGLRDCFEGEACAWRELDEGLGFGKTRCEESGRDACRECIGSIICAIADRIEYEYIPRPRYEDGEPVQFRDDIEIYDRNGLLDKGIIQSFHPNRGPVWMISLVGCDHERLVRFDPETCVIKRPTPTVLDADGVAYERGETVYGIEDGAAFEILNPYMREGYMEARELQGKREICEIKPPFYTHERPIFDAGGECIRKGDTVWPIDDPTMDMTVDNFQCIYGQEVTVNCEREGDFYNFSPQYLTHREPDSLEKLRDDMKEWMANSPDAMFMDSRWVDRLAALIERGE